MKLVGKVMGIDLSKVDEKVLEESLEDAELDDDREPLPKRIAKLAVHHKTKAARKGEKATCTECGGVSSTDEKRCPFCGESGQVEAPPRKVPPKKSDKAAAAKAGGKKKRSEVVTTGVEIVDKTASVSDLDRNVALIHRLGSGAAESLYELGCAIKDNIDRSLWKARRNPKNGKHLFDSFREFSERELGISGAYAHKLVAIVENFPKKLLVELGPSKLGLVINVPEEHRRKLIDAAKGGATREQLSDEAKRLRDGRPEPSSKPDKDAMTLALGPRLVDVPFYKRANRSTGGPLGSAATLAETIADDPWAIVELSNKVSVLIRIGVKDGKLRCLWEARRTKPLAGADGEED